VPPRELPVQKRKNKGFSLDLKAFRNGITLGVVFDLKKVHPDRPAHGNRYDQARLPRKVREEEVKRLQGANSTSMIRRSRGLRWKYGYIAVLVGCALLLATLGAGCTSAPATVKTGDTVKVDYEVSLPGNPVFETNENSTPLEFVVGSGSMISGFDSAVIGMSAGETKTVIIPAEQAYGPYRPDLVSVLPADKVFESVQALEEAGAIREVDYPGMEPIYEYALADGTHGYLRFSNITDETITVDENPPLAGKDLQFKITVVEIIPAGTS
jgi:peptidylprolyl isomerase